jgi:UDP-N-acetylmuramoyl-tripeptide--D-alanyl-D-alanine ligase
MSYSYTLTSKELSSLHTLFLQTKHTTFDSREVKSGSFFVALVGESSDGNLFVQKALDSRASLVLTNNKDFKDSERCFFVEDTLKAFWDLAHFHRNTFSFPIIAIGGSNGKTTTKELLAHTLSTKYNVCKTYSSFNNQTGVPLTLLSLNKSHQFGIIEIGANHLGEHADLIPIIHPSHLYITNNGKDHLEGFGSEENARKANNELYAYAAKNDVTTFVSKNNLDQIHDTQKLTFTMPTKEFGSDYVCENKDLDNFTCSLSLTLPDLKEFEISSNLVGDYNAHNIRAVLAICEHFNMTKEAIKKAIESYIPSLLRSQILIDKERNNTLFVDCYNANPSSMRLSLDSFIKKMDNKKRFVFLADMRELGKFSLFEHQQIVDFLQNEHEKSNFAGIFLIGCEFSKTKKFSFAQRFQSVREFLESNIYKKESISFENAYFFFKGSRGPNPKCPLLLPVVESVFGKEIEK